MAAGIVKLEKTDRDGRVRRKAGEESEAVEGASEAKVADVRGGLEEGRDGESVGGEVAGAEEGEEAEGVVRVGEGEGESLDGGGEEE